MIRFSFMKLSQLVAETEKLSRNEFVTRFPTPALLFGEPLSARRSTASDLARPAEDLDQIYELTDAYSLDPPPASKPPRFGVESRVEFLPANPAAGETQEKLVTLGRAPDSDLQVAAISVSLTHAGFMLSAKGWSIVDAGSTNGTTLNGRALRGDEAALLRDGDAIGFWRDTHAIYLSPGALFDRLRA